MEELQHQQQTLISQHTDHQQFPLIQYRTRNKDLDLRNMHNSKLALTMEKNQIGDYKFVKTLGQGTFGKVKQGIHIHTQQKVAIKILEKRKITDVSDVERVTREIHILKIVRHPHIIQLYDIIETQKRLYLIMEHCTHGELFTYITSRGGVKESEACKLFQQLISGIEYLTELGIAHRDIKPENLLLDEFRNLKIVDFGLSSTFTPGEKLHTACGSPCYAAPELIKGHTYVAQKADIWSAGVVLFTSVSGYLPFEDQNTQQLYQQILKADYTLPNTVSKEVRDLIAHILVPDPDLRYGIKQIKQHKWFRDAYQPKHQISQGIKIGIDMPRAHVQILDELREYYKIDDKLVRQCIEANRHNQLTSFYYLLLKKKRLEGHKIEDHFEMSGPADIINETKRERRLISKDYLLPQQSQSPSRLVRRVADDIQEVSILDQSLQNAIDDSSSSHTQATAQKNKPSDADQVVMKIIERGQSQDIQRKQHNQTVLIERQSKLQNNKSLDVSLLQHTTNSNAHSISPSHTINHGRMNTLKDLQTTLQHFTNNTLVQQDQQKHQRARIKSRFKITAPQSNTNKMSLSTRLGQYKTNQTLTMPLGTSVEAFHQGTPELVQASNQPLLNIQDDSNLTMKSPARNRMHYRIATNSSKPNVNQQILRHQQSLSVEAHLRITKKGNKIIVYS